MIDTFYNVTLSPREGPTNLQIRVDGDDGAVRIEVYTQTEKGRKIKSVFTFESDTDLKTLTEIIKWARFKSLEAQGFRVVM